MRYLGLGQLRPATPADPDHIYDGPPVAVLVTNVRGWNNLPVGPNSYHALYEYEERVVQGLGWNDAEEGGCAYLVKNQIWTVTEAELRLRMERPDGWDKPSILDQMLLAEAEKRELRFGPNKPTGPLPNQRQTIAKDVRMFVWQRDGGRCVECQSNTSLEFDHIIPLSMGGANTERNLQLLCEPCNRRKGATLG